MDFKEFQDHIEGCKINFLVDFEFRSKLLEKVIGTLFTDAVTRMVLAFENRAKHLYAIPEVEGSRAARC